MSLTQTDHPTRCCRSGDSAHSHTEEVIPHKQYAYVWVFNNCMVITAGLHIIVMKKIYYGAESLLPLYFWMPVFSYISEKLPVFHSVNVIVFMCSDNDTLLTVTTKSEDCWHSSNHVQTHYTLYLMETLVTTKALETIEEIVS